MAAIPEEVAFCWSQFESAYPREEDCVEEFFRYYLESGLIKCHHCGNRDVEHVFGQRVTDCRRCNKKSWFTAKTFFHSMKLARPWLGSIWFREHGVELNSKQLERLANIAYSTAWEIFQKITTVVRSAMQDTCSDVTSKRMIDVFRRRSLETPAREHPSAEQEEMEMAMERRASEKDKGSEQRDSAEESEHAFDAGVLSREEQAVCSFLSTEPAHFDSLCHQTTLPAWSMSAALINLELKGLIASLAGNRFVRWTSVKQPNSPATDFAADGMIDTFINHIFSNFHGISRKYVQNYLAAFWCQMDRMRWHAGSLLKACVLFRPIRDSEILSYVSPLVLKMFVG